MNVDEAAREIETYLHNWWAGKWTEEVTRQAINIVFERYEEANVKSRV